MHRFAKESKRPDSYAIKPILCATNSFKIGTNGKPGLARMAKLGIEKKFNDWQGSEIHRTIQDSIRTLIAGQKTYDVEI